ncbi:MAG: RnfABCDGE type electron transport complex subunit D [Bacillota bacterium]|jgi:electron transport complex protein RnfD|nr:RnfABCDGE type electron transport complex subunit D [Bacillota bacterium]
MAESTLIVSPAPHIRSGVTTPALMRDVVISLIPACAAGVYFFGARALVSLAAAIVGTVGAEYILERITGRPVTIGDWSAVVTGVLLAMVLPPHVPWWILVLSGFFTIGVVKLLFGGLGFNVFNPALAGRAFAVAAWSALANSGYIWPAGAEAAHWVQGFDAVSTATPLTLLKMGEIGGIPMTRFYAPLFFGNVAGSLGETSALALLVGAAYLLWREHISLRIPLTYIGTVAVITSLYGHDPLFHILSGGLILGAFFMATDYVTSPMNPKGQTIFAIGCGVLTALIRIFGGYPEGVCYSILIMNAAVPLIDRFARPKRFGEVKARGQNA